MYTASHGLYRRTQLFKAETDKVLLAFSIAQNRLDSLALISIENKAARQLDSEEVVDKFAHSKARKRQF